MFPRSASSSPATPFTTTFTCTCLSPIKGPARLAAALLTIESLHPKAVVAGHKRATRDDDPRIIGETRQYIRDFNRVIETTTTARDLYHQVLKLHPGRLNPGALWTSARVLKS